jgi:predicted membrane channel-forming protein YqfA (hemolysin III family)
VIRLGGSDCEHALAGLLAQPVNALSSLAFIPVGVLTVVAAMRATGWLRLHLAVFAGALIAVGLGSFAYHGPQPAWAGPAHDGSIVLALACAIVPAATAGRRRTRIWRTGPGRLAAALVVVALAAYAAGRTGSPLCDPDSRIQFHAVWHVLAAGSALAFARAALPLCARAS